VERVRPRPVESNLAMGAGAARQRTSTTSTGRTRGCPWLGGDQPEARNGTTRLAEEGGALDGVDGHVAGGTMGARSESVRVGRAMGRSKERVAQDEGTREEMATTVNAEWGRLTASRRCEAYDGRASRKIFFKRDGRDVQRRRQACWADSTRRPGKRRPIEQTPDFGSIFISHSINLR
jgi:hypothetical protein